MKPEAEAAWRRAVEFAPGYEAARKKLGCELNGGIWMLPAEKALRAEIADITKAPQGAEDAGKSEVAEKLAVTFTRRASDHFLLESSCLDTKALADLVQRAEHCFAMFHKVFGAKELLKEKYDIILLKDKTEHDKYIDTYHKGTAEQKEFSKKQSGWGGYPRHESYVGTRPVSSQQDFVVHYPAQAMMGAMSGGKALWLLEGGALWFTNAIEDTAIWACVDMAGTGGGGGGRNKRDPKNWGIIIKTWLAEGKDPAIDGVLKCTKWSEFDGDEAIKAWSLLDFLMIEHKEKLVKFLADVKIQKDNGEKSIQAILGWTLEEFDLRWRTWARAAYENAK